MAMKSSQRKLLSDFKYSVFTSYSLMTFRPSLLNSFALFCVNDLTSSRNFSFSFVTSFKICRTFYKRRLILAHIKLSSNYGFLSKISMSLSYSLSHCSSS